MKINKEKTGRSENESNDIVLLESRRRFFDALQAVWLPHSQRIVKSATTWSHSQYFSRNITNRQDHLPIDKILQFLSLLYCDTLTDTELPGFQGDMAHKAPAKLFHQSFYTWFLEHSLSLTVNRLLQGFGVWLNQAHTVYTLSNVDDRTHLFSQPQARSATWSILLNQAIQRSAKVGEKVRYPQTVEKRWQSFCAKITNGTSVLVEAHEAIRIVERFLQTLCINETGSQQPRGSDLPSFQMIQPLLSVYAAIRAAEIRGGFGMRSSKVTSTGTLRQFVETRQVIVSRQFDSIQSSSRFGERFETRTEVMPFGTFRQEVVDRQTRRPLSGAIFGNSRKSETTTEFYQVPSLEMGSLSFSAHRLSEEIEEAYTASLLTAFAAEYQISLQHKHMGVKANGGLPKVKSGEVLTVASGAPWKSSTRLAGAKVGQFGKLSYDARGEISKRSTRNAEGIAEVKNGEPSPEAKTGKGLRGTRGGEGRPVSKEDDSLFATKVRGRQPGIKNDDGSLTANGNVGAPAMKFAARGPETAFDVRRKASDSQHSQEYLYARVVSDHLKQGWQSDREAASCWPEMLTKIESWLRLKQETDLAFTEVGAISRTAISKLNTGNGVIREHHSTNLLQTSNYGSHQHILTDTKTMSVQAENNNLLGSSQAAKSMEIGQEIVTSLLDRNLTLGTVHKYEVGQERQMESAFSEFTFLRREEDMRPPQQSYAYAQPMRQALEEDRVVKQVQEKQVVEIVRTEVETVMKSRSPINGLSRADYSQIADQVYTSLVRRLIVEKERGGLHF